MAQVIQQSGGLWGELGKGFGQGLSEQLPKEVERHRLSQGLKKLGEQKDLTPFQQFTGLVSQPGMTPQIIQSGQQLLQQQAYLNSLKNQYEGNGGPQSGNKGYAPTQEELSNPSKGEVPTLATPEATAESYKTFIPPTEQEERKDAFENFKQNPARYNNDFEKALSERKAITSRNQEIQKAYQAQEATAVGKEAGVKSALQAEVSKLQLGNIPPKAYQKFEEKVLNSVLSKKDGGEGLTQEQGVNKYSKELAQANRNYLDLSSLSSWSPRDFNARTNALQKEFASRGEEQMMMDQLIAEQGISPMYAAHKSYPIKKGEMPTLNKLSPPSIRGVGIPKPINDITYEQLKKEMGETNSPLSIAYQLQKHDQDPRGWINYLDNHRDDLKVWQADQLTKNQNILDLQDLWLSTWE